jgi:agmatine/peptidylarginine deiminase
MTDFPLTWRLPAEWEPQDGVLLAWPHAGTDWAPILDQVEDSYAALVAAITRFETAVVIAADAAIEVRARAMALAAGADAARLRTVRAEYDDTWLRDSGPITLTDGTRHRLLDFRFTGWGGKYGAERDDRLIGRLVEAGLFRADVELERIDFALEGGAIDSDGAGNILTTWQCLAQRHPDATPQAIEVALSQFLHATRVAILEHGALEGDDTDAHIDTLARFAAADLIVHQACDDPADPHHAGLAAMAAELAALRRADGSPYRLAALPWAQPIHDADGRRLAASYANFLIVDGAVLVPAYGDPADAAARAVLAECFPGREIVGVPCRPLIEENGSLHCITMQLPRGVLA